MDSSIINFFNEFIVNNKIYIVWLGTFSLIIFIFSLLSLKWLVSFIPYDYFTNNSPSKLKSEFFLIWIMLMIVKNIIGYILIVGGILMLVLPGQGLFTILIGLMLSNYPGKFYIEKRFIAIPSILKMINWLRKKTNTPKIKI